MRNSAALSWTEWQRRTAGAIGMAAQHTDAVGCDLSPRNGIVAMA